MTLLQLGTASLEDAQRAMTEQIAHVAAILAAKRAAGSHDNQLSSHLAFLGEKQAVMTREQRQIEAHERDAAAAMTAEEVDNLIVSMVLDLPVERMTTVVERLVTAKKERLL